MAGQARKHTTLYLAIPTTSLICLDCETVLNEPPLLTVLDVAGIAS